MARENIIALKYSVASDKDVNIVLKTGIDKNVWDISGKHLNYINEAQNGNSLELNAETVQLKNKLKVLAFRQKLSMLLKESTNLREDIISLLKEV